MVIPWDDYPWDNLHLDLLWVIRSFRTYNIDPYGLKLQIFLLDINRKSHRVYGIRYQDAVNLVEFRQLERLLRVYL
jgi:hypothetical protein